MQLTHHLVQRRMLVRCTRPNDGKKIFEDILLDVVGHDEFARANGSVTKIMVYKATHAIPASGGRSSSVKWPHAFLFLHSLVGTKIYEVSAAQVVPTYTAILVSK